MAFKPVILWTDALIYILIITSFVFILWARRRPLFHQAWRQVLARPMAMLSLIILSLFIFIGFTDSLHFQTALKQHQNGGQVHYSPKTQSIFDLLIRPIGQFSEKTYSAPFATTLFVKETVHKPDGSIVREYPHLQHAAIGINTSLEKAWDISKRIGVGVLLGSIVFLLIAALLLLRLKFKLKTSFKETFNQIKTNQTHLPWRLIFITLFILSVLIAISLNLAYGYHVFGTGKVGQDIFYQTLKSIRTGLVIGTLTTLIMLPFAIFLGVMAGYFGGRIDDVIQYIYTTLSSIPGVLLIAAAVLSLQIFISNHPDYFPNLEMRADARLLALCLILGVTSWTGLCRLLRGETLKLREIDYVQAAHALGTGRIKILVKHIIPNVMHIVLIAVVLDFSTLVLAEAVLSYVGVGVSPTTISWGNMINSARMELAREPIVWWPLLAAFIFMFLLVLSANLFSDAVRDAFDPKVTD